MNKNNVGYLHQLIFAVAVIVLVYSGEQVKANSTGASSWLMRSAAMAASAGICFLGLSFIPAVKNNLKTEAREHYEKAVASLYYYDGVELAYIRKDTVQNIELAGRTIGELAAVQDVTHKWSMRFNCWSLVCVTLSSLLFCIGVCLL